MNLKKGSIKMEKKEICLEMLKKYGCLTAKQVSLFAKRTLGEDITPNSASGHLRALASVRKVGYSRQEGKTTYWLIKEEN